MKKNIPLETIGVIRTPYIDIAPFRADEKIQDGEYIIEINPELEEALYKLDTFNYIQVLF